MTISCSRISVVHCILSLREKTIIFLIKNHAKTSTVYFEAYSVEEAL